MRHLIRVYIVWRSSRNILKVMEHTSSIHRIIMVGRYVVLTLRVNTVLKVASYYENKPVQIYWKFTIKKKNHIKIWYFFIFLLKNEVVPTSTHNLCFLRSNKNNNVYPCKPQLYYIKVGFKGVKIIQARFRDERHLKGTECTFKNFRHFWQGR